MKSKIIVVLLAICLMGATTEDVKTVFTTKDIIWYGLDFTSAKFIGDFNGAGKGGETSGSDIVKKWIPAWNNLILYEREKYDIQKAFSKENVYYDINKITSLNAKIDPDKCITANTPEPITASEISKMIAKYSGDKKEGLGLSFIVENFNKYAVSADVYVVFFDIASKKVLLSEKVKGKPSGFGVKNYWGGAISHILKQIGTTDFKFWENKTK